MRGPLRARVSSEQTWLRRAASLRFLTAPVRLRSAWLQTEGNMHPQTLYGKLVNNHTVLGLDDENVLLYVDLHVLNEYTSPQAFAGLRERGIGVDTPNHNRAAVEHIIPTHAGRPHTI